MYLYTQPLANSTCRQGNLAAFNFCYKAIISMSITKPVFIIVLLIDTGSEYIVSHIYREMEDRVFCLSSSNEARCCKWVTVDRTTPLVVNSSFTLAVITSSTMVNGHLYETSSFSRGVLYSPPPDLPEEGSSVVGLERRTASQIPELFLRLVLTAACMVCLYPYEFLIQNTCCDYSSIYSCRMSPQVLPLRDSLMNICWLWWEGVWLSWPCSLYVLLS